MSSEIYWLDVEKERLSTADNKADFNALQHIDSRPSHDSKDEGPFEMATIGEKEKGSNLDDALSYSHSSFESSSCEYDDKVGNPQRGSSNNSLKRKKKKVARFDLDQNIEISPE